MTYYSVKEEMCPGLSYNISYNAAIALPTRTGEFQILGANRKLVWLAKPTKQDLRVLWEFLVRIRKSGWIVRQRSVWGGSLARSQAQIDQ